jgi:WD40 repeat protein
VALVRGADGLRVEKRQGAVLIMDAQGTVLQSFMHDSRVATARLSPDGSRLVTTTRKGACARIWDVESGRVVECRINNARFRDAELSPDGHRLLTAADDGTLHLWDANEGGMLGRIASPYFITRCHFSPDGSLAVTASLDGAELWDLRTGKLRAVLRAHGCRVSDAIFSPEGDTVLTAAGDGTVRTWPVRTEDLLDAAKRRAYRDFTPEERERFADLLAE